MTSPDTPSEPDRPVSPLVTSRRQRATDTRKAAESALRRLVKRKAPITFAAVAAEAGVSTGYLHRHPDLAPKIRQLRDAQHTQPALHTVTAEPTIIDTLRDHIRRLQADHNRQIRELHAENAALRAHLQAALGELIALRSQGRKP